MLPNLICQLPRKKFIFVRTLIKFNKCIPSGQTILNERHEKSMKKFKYLTKENLSPRILKVSIVSGSLPFAIGVSELSVFARESNCPPRNLFPVYPSPRLVSGHLYRHKWRPSGYFTLF